MLFEHKQDRTLSFFLRPPFPRHNRKASRFWRAIRPPLIEKLALLAQIRSTNLGAHIHFGGVKMEGGNDFQMPASSGAQ